MTEFTVRSSRSLVLVALCALVAAPGVVCAQDQPPLPAAPYRGLFGGAWTDPGFRRSLEVIASLTEGLDDNLQVAAPNYSARGTYTGVTGGIDFQSRGDTVQWRAGGGTNVRYYPGLLDPTAVSHYQSGGISLRLPWRTTATVNETAAYSPSFLYGMFPTAATAELGAPITPVTPAADYSVTNSRFYTLAANVEIRTNITRRASLSAVGGLDRTDPVGSSPQLFRTNASNIGARFTYGFSRTGSLRLGYQVRDVTLPSSLRLREQNLDIGVDYQRPLSRSRRTTVAFTASTTSFTGPVYNAPVNTYAQQYGVTADASLNHRFGRTWNLTGVYHRGINIIEGFEVPLFTNGVTVSVLGFVDRRIDMTATGAYSTGNSIMVSAQSNVATSTGDVRFRYALNGSVAVYAEGVYYYYNFDRSLQLPAGVTPRLQRTSVRVGLTYWARPWRQR